jgi:hypothetical protein
VHYDTTVLSIADKFQTESSMTVPVTTNNENEGSLRLQHGLVQGSFVPPTEIQDLRDLTRYRVELTQAQNRVANRIQKVLEQANIKLSLGRIRHARRFRPTDDRSHYRWRRQSGTFGRSSPQEAATTNTGFTGSPVGKGTRSPSFSVEGTHE